MRHCQILRHLNIRATRQFYPLLRQGLLVLMSTFSSVIATIPSHVYAQTTVCDNLLVQTDSKAAKITWRGLEPSAVLFETSGTDGKGPFRAEDSYYKLPIELGPLIVEGYHKIRAYDEKRRRDGSTYTTVFEGPLEDSIQAMKKKQQFEALQARVEELFLLVRNTDEILKLAKSIALPDENLFMVRQQIEAIYLKTTPSADGYVRIPMSLLLPDYAQSRLNSKPRCWGINCFHTAVNFHRTTWSTLISYFFPSIFQRVINKPELFRELSESEKLRYGDLLVVTSVDSQHKEVYDHAMIYIGNGIIFHKPDVRQETRFTFESLDSAGLPYFLTTNYVSPNSHIRFFRSL